MRHSNTKKTQKHLSPALGKTAFRTEQHTKNLVLPSLRRQSRRFLTFGGGKWRPRPANAIEQSRSNCSNKIQETRYEAEI